MSQLKAPPTYTLDVDAHTLILQEIQTLTAFIRRSPRWAAAPQSAYSSAYYSIVVGPKIAAAASKDQLATDLTKSQIHSRTSSLVAQKAQQQPQPPLANTAPPATLPKRTHVSIVRDESTGSTSRPSSALGMRKSTGGGVSGSGSGLISGIESEEMDLLAGFVGLKRSLAQIQDFTEIPPIDIIQPFLALIRSPLTSGPITSLALTSLNTLITHILPCYQPYPLPPLTSQSFTISSTPTPLQLALPQITSTIARCRFPSTNPAQDDVVLLRLLKVTESLVTGHLERDLNDEAVCEILEVGLGMGGRPRLSEGLRRTAQNTVGAIVKAGFGRLKVMDPKIVLGEASQINSIQTEKDLIGALGGDAAVSTKDEDFNEKDEAEEPSGSKKDIADVQDSTKAATQPAQASDSGVAECKLSGVYSRYDK
ncbi:hypothetical protein QFC19_001917 [Naganishia cerealis]|uniref:Uncharacterized protein n=1 Tax=Naganishia cerealis TaxID=610337 RepID=A0ACC2WDF1_9TREE|nr:hypothetical protein QFC19_001917 [Naganishia cerealis]